MIFTKIIAEIFKILAENLEKIYAENIGRKFFPRFARASLRNPERIFKKNLGENLPIPSPLPLTRVSVSTPPGGGEGGGAFPWGRTG